MDKVINFAKNLILKESQSLAALSETVNHGFVEGVMLLENRPPRARVVCTGVGKAGFIAAKTSATLSSIGVASFVLDPADALHGDLGSLVNGDVVIAFSFSGETSEIVSLIPVCKEIGCPLIGITSQGNSTLGQGSDALIPLGQVDEAGPMGLAPTTSTTLMLSISNALCMTLLSRSPFSREDFARFHPAGSLGRRLRKVREVMRIGDKLCTVGVNDLVRDVLQKISKTPGRPGAAVVVEKGELQGIFTDGDLRRCLTADKDFLDLPVSKYMGGNPKTIDSESLCDDALKILTEHKIDQIIVISPEKKVLGLLDIQDVARI